MSHPSREALSRVSSNPQIDTSSKDKHNSCYVCLRGKRTRIPFLVGENKASDCFDLIHCDIWVGYHTKSSCGASQFLTILDDASHGLWTYLMKGESEALVKIFV